MNVHPSTILPKIASSRRSSLASVVLPGIRDIFPEYISPLRASFQASPPQSHSFTSPAFSFDVLKADPRAASLVHVSSSQQRPRVRPPVLPRAKSLSPSSDGDSEEQQGGSSKDSGHHDKKHVCATCEKRFSRPSGLKIHVNSHTGALPYICPHPNCGRAFNVHSNMRRHYRKHFTSSSNSPPYAPAPLPASSTSPYLASSSNAPSTTWSHYIPAPTGTNSTSPLWILTSPALSLTGTTQE